MRNTFRHQNDTKDRAEHLRRFWTATFADEIQLTREAAGRSIEQTARLAGMELSEWMALEAGAWLPQTPEQLRAIAGALEMNYDQLCSLVLHCLPAWP